MHSKASNPNYEVYNRPDVVKNYAEAEGLEVCEAYAFDKYIHTGEAILDLGVGGGRTTPTWSQRPANTSAWIIRGRWSRLASESFPTLNSTAWTRAT